MNLELNKIYLADCYDFIKKIPNNSVDLIYTDIPYLYNQGSGGNSELGLRTAKKRLNLMGINSDIYEEKNISYNELLELANKNLIAKENENIEKGIDYSILDEFCRIMKNINCFIWCSKLQIFDIMEYFIKKKNCLFEILTWNKTNPIPQTNNTWLPDIEYCLYFKEPNKIKLNEDYHLKSKWYISSINKKDKEKFKHDTIKPLELVKRHILHTTKENDLIFDPFVGSGTTAVACKELNRQFLACEINEKWYNIANDRLNNIRADGQITMFLE